MCFYFFHRRTYPNAAVNPSAAENSACMALYIDLSLCVSCFVMLPCYVCHANAGAVVNRVCIPLYIDLSLYLSCFVMLPCYVRHANAGAAVNLCT